MMKRKFKKYLKSILAVRSLLWLALILALVSSLKHVAWGFATLERGNFNAGLLAAIAVDIGLLALAIGIQQRRRQNRSNLLLWLGIIFFAAISIYANLIHGMVNRADIGLHRWDWMMETGVEISQELLETLQWSSFLLDLLRPIFFSGVLPVLFIYLTEVAAGDVVYQLALKELKKSKKKKKKAEDAEPPAKPPVVPSVAAKTGSEKVEEIAASIVKVREMSAEGKTAAQIAKEQGIPLTAVLRAIEVEEHGEE